VLFKALIGAVRKAGNNARILPKVVMWLGRLGIYSPVFFPFLVQKVGLCAAEQPACSESFSGPALTHAVPASPELSFKNFSLASKNICTLRHVGFRYSQLSPSILGIARQDRTNSSFHRPFCRSYPSCNKQNAYSTWNWKHSYLLVFSGLNTSLKKPALEFLCPVWTVIGNKMSYADCTWKQSVAYRPRDRLLDLQKSSMI